LTSQANGIGLWVHSLGKSQQKITTNDNLPPIQKSSVGSQKNTPQQNSKPPKASLMAVELQAERSLV
jgi:hypothetical protein